ncbi:hypothetical protein LWM68_43930 [Niabella sp. W65]|nr:hypothetical protein [Niabella sp. W65]MCH7369073.1 hypothetical protein [Niabella sp. W65]
MGLLFIHFSGGGHCIYYCPFFLSQGSTEKEDELHQAKLNFFTNASHEIRTHLTLIMAPVERLLSENKKSRLLPNSSRR